MFFNFLQPAVVLSFVGLLIFGVQGLKKQTVQCMQPIVPALLFMVILHQTTYIFSSVFYGIFFLVGSIQGIFSALYSGVQVEQSVYTPLGSKNFRFGVTLLSYGLGYAVVFLVLKVLHIPFTMEAFLMSVVGFFIFSFFQYKQESAKLMHQYKLLVPARFYNLYFVVCSVSAYGSLAYLTAYYPMYASYYFMVYQILIGSIAGFFVGQFFGLMSKIKTV